MTFMEIYYMFQVIGIVIGCIVGAMYAIMLLAIFWNTRDRSK